ncbi:cdc42 effector protein 2-like [Hypanus sabinus]|uniref:cdc42 effector protein 2-like n=1 Tax=Hypanus sabinus TaxID=79690 RepID=UPI0028C37D88|nr:cdc42 effector protein 2-like [Hypanus sabinus]XP_059809112.1 cdc42 effector protein 2-like [Hypanus sabinus]
MSVKSPIYLKTGLTKKGKKPKLREVLSADMISPPLGDFHHKSHIGRRGEGDTFGDMSFLQGQGDLLSSLSTSKDPRDVAPPKPPRLHLGEPNDTADVNSTQATPESPDNQPPTPYSPSVLYHLQEASEEAPPDDKQIGDKDQQQTEDEEGWECSAQREVDDSHSSPSEYMFQFELDLGPSILEDVLKIMDNHKSITSQQ